MKIEIIKTPIVNKVTFSSDNEEEINKLKEAIEVITDFYQFGDISLDVHYHTRIEK